MAVIKREKTSKRRVAGYIETIALQRMLIQFSDTLRADVVPAPVGIIVQRIRQIWIQLGGSLQRVAHSFIAGHIQVLAIGVVRFGELRIQIECPTCRNACSFSVAEEHLHIRQPGPGQRISGIQFGRASIMRYGAL